MPPVIRPMTADRQDNDDAYTELGRVIIGKVGLDLKIIKGAGSTEESSFSKLFYACTDKLDQRLGVDNFVLLAHSSSLNRTDGFSQLLDYEDGSNNPLRSLDVSQLVLKIGDLVTVYQASDDKYYTFKIVSIDGDESVNHQLVTDKMADIEGKPQLTLYACSKVGENDDGRIVIQADFVSKN
jgi:sortase (surface protein transpeptidase)